MEMNTLSSDIHSAAVSLGALAGSVTPETWEYLRIVRRQLQASADQVAHLEKTADISRRAVLVHVHAPLHTPSPYFPHAKPREERRHD